MLKTTNYEIKELGIVIPEAFAVAQVDTKNSRAIFLVATSREKALSGNTIQEVVIYVNYDRAKNPFEVAYNTAKGQKTEIQFNEETGHYEKVTVNQPFYGWDDDIVTE